MREASPQGNGFFIRGSFLTVLGHVDGHRSHRGPGIRAPSGQVSLGLRGLEDYAMRAEHT
eukprot:7013015-Pyramimonas_sp.AAC.1